MEKNTGKLLSNTLLILVLGAFLTVLLPSCGKSNAASPTGLNIQYQIFNLSPDMGPVNLFIAYKQVNTIGNPFVFEINHGYFYVPATDTPYQIRSALAAGTPIMSRHDILKSGAKYSLFIVGNLSDNSDTSIFTVDTATAPKVGHGKLRFVNASPTATGGLDVFANDTLAFSKIVYKRISGWVELPAGNYDIKIRSTGNPNVLNEQPQVTIQNGRLYTLYAYGYSTRADSAKFNAAVLTNK